MGAKQLKKTWHLIKTTVAKTNWTKVKNAPYKNDRGQKNRSQTVEDKKWHLIKMTVAKINEPHSARWKNAI